MARNKEPPQEYWLDIQQEKGNIGLYNEADIFCISKMCETVRVTKEKVCAFDFR